MVKIINEIDGKKYELIPEINVCEGCAFCDEEICCALANREYDRCFHRINICGRFKGIWKEVKDGNK